MTRAIVNVRNVSRLPSPCRVIEAGKQKSIPLDINASDTELVFGWKFTDLEQTITDLISQYIEPR